MRWTWWEMLLWTYSTLWTFIIVLITFLDVLGQRHIASSQTPDAQIWALISLLPILAFLVMEGLKHLRN